MQLTELSNLHIASKALTLYDAGYFTYIFQKPYRNGRGQVCGMGWKEGLREPPLANYR